MAENPYAAPRTPVADPPLSLPDGAFIPSGRSVPAGNGWRWIADAWAFTGLQRGTFIGVFLLWALIAIVLSMIPRLGQVVSGLLMPVVTAGFMLGCDDVRRGAQLEVGHLFAGFRNHTGKLITLGAIYVVFFVAMVLLIMAIFGSTVGMVFLGTQPAADEMTAVLLPLLLASLVMLALSLPVYMAMWFACPLIVLAQVDVSAALRTSFGACLKNIVPFLIWSIAIFFLAIFASIPLGLGWLLLGPVLVASVYLSYRDIFHEI